MLQRHERAQIKDCKNGQHDCLIHQERQRPPAEAGDLRRPIALGHLVVTVDDRPEIRRGAVSRVRKNEGRPGRIGVDPRPAVDVIGPVNGAGRRARNLAGPGIVPGKQVVVDAKGRAVIVVAAYGACGRRPVETGLPGLQRIVFEHLDEIAAGIDAACRRRS